MAILSSLIGLSLMMSFQCYLYLFYSPARTMKVVLLLLFICLGNIYLHGLRNLWQILFHIGVAFLSSYQILTRQLQEKQADCGVWRRHCVIDGSFGFLRRVICISLLASQPHLKFPPLKFPSTKPGWDRKLGIFNRCSRRHKVAWFPSPGFVLSVTAESPGQHILGQQNLGTHSQGALWKDQNGIVLVF